MTPASAQSSLLLDLENAFKSRDANERGLVLERIAGLFLSGTSNQDQVELFDEVFSQLVRQVEATARAKLRERLAASENAPGRVLQSRARDDEIEVAGPVLAYSSQVSEESLVDIAKTKSQ